MLDLLKEERDCTLKQLKDLHYTNQRELSKHVWTGVQRVMDQGSSRRGAVVNESD